jgi:hypothetical protein
MTVKIDPVDGTEARMGALFKECYDGTAVEASYLAHSTDGKGEKGAVWCIWAGLVCSEARLIRLGTCIDFSYSVLSLLGIYKFPSPLPWLGFEQASIPSLVSNGFLTYT